jgi:hypothetical protein
LDADTRARLISLGQDPDKVEEAVAAIPAPTLADHLAALAALVQPVAAPVAPAPVEASPVVTENLAAPALVTQVEAAPVATPFIPTEAPAPAPTVEAAYTPINQIYAPPANTLPEVIVDVPAVAAALAPPPWPAPAPAAALFPEPVINYSPSGRYLEVPAEDHGAHIEFGDDPQVVEFKKHSTMETQVDGDHYVKCAIQPLDYIMANKLGFVEGNIVKYATRWQDKDGVVDLKKARDYLDKLIAYVEATS